MEAIMSNVVTLTPEQFVAHVNGLRREPVQTPDNYFIRNLDTGKVELHITKPAYKARGAEDRKALWSLFRWSRDDGCWFSREAASETSNRLDAIAGLFGLKDCGYFVTLAPAATEAVAPDEASQYASHDSPAPEEKPGDSGKRPEGVSPDSLKTVGFPDADEIMHALRRGSGFEGGKFRIAAFYSAHHAPSEAKQFLQEEYGTGGHSHTFLNGASGFVDYDRSGMKLRLWKQNAETKLSWITVDSYLREMIRKGAYLTEREQAEFNSVIAANHGKIQTPVPRMHYPPVKKGV